MLLRSRARRVVARALLGMSSAVVALLITEIVLRIAGISYPVPTQRDLECGYSYVPGAKWVHTTEGRSHVSINRFGFRDREWQTAKPRHIKRLAVIGDSFVAALEVEADQRFPAILERELQTHRAPGGDEIEVLNFGQAGYGTAQELMVLRHKVWQFDPDYVLLAMFTANDICNNSKALNQEPLFPYFDLQNGKLVLDESFRRYEQPWSVRAVKQGAKFLRTAQLVYRAKQAKQAFQARWRENAAIGREAELFQLGFNDPSSAAMIYSDVDDPEWKAAWQVTEALLAEFEREVRSHGARFFVVTLSNDIQVYPDRSLRDRFLAVVRGTSIFYPDERIGSVAAQLGIPVLTLAPTLQRYAEETAKYLHGFENTRMGWGHWNQDGHRVAGTQIAEWLAEQLDHPAGK